MATPKLTVFTDSPPRNPSDDLLNHRSFAEHIANLIRNIPSSAGFVIAINGPWGAGKTTLLNFVEYYLREPLKERPIFVHFNPWWFSGHRDLTERFFAQLQASLNDSSNNQRVITQAKKVLAALAPFAQAISALPVPGVAVAGAGIQAANELATSMPDLPKQKERIDAALQSLETRVVVFIDDIDRLTADEIRQVFRVIKAIANFQNVVYLVAFDQAVAIKALGGEQLIPGDQYLEKIVQVPIELPMPTQSTLENMFLANLRVVLSNDGIGILDTDRWIGLFITGVRYFLRTPRAVSRLVNSLTFMYTAIKDEVNAIDFIGLETLRLFVPLAYEMIRKNSAAFIGPTRRDPLGIMSVDTMKIFHSEWLKNIPPENRRPTEQILVALFPNLGSVLGPGPIYSQPSALERAESRISSPQRFDRYFQFAIAEGDISDVEIRSLLALTGDTDGFAALLLALANRKGLDNFTQAQTLLDAMFDLAESKIARDHIANVLCAFLRVGDKLIELEDRELTKYARIPNSSRIMYILRALIRKLPDSNTRRSILGEAISENCAPATGTELLEWLGAEHGKNGETDQIPEAGRLLTAADLDFLEHAMALNIRHASTNGTLLDAPLLGEILDDWCQWGETVDVENWVKEVFADDGKLMRLLERLLAYRRGPFVNDDNSFAIGAFDRFLDRTIVANRFSALLNIVKVPEDISETIKIFVKIVEQNAGQVS